MDRKPTIKDRYSSASRAKLRSYGLALSASCEAESASGLSAACFSQYHLSNEARGRDPSGRSAPSHFTDLQFGNFKQFDRRQSIAVDQRGPAIAGRVGIRGLGKYLGKLGSRFHLPERQ